VKSATVRQSFSKRSGPGGGGSYRPKNRGRRERGEARFAWRVECTRGKGGGGSNLPRVSPGVTEN